MQVTNVQASAILTLDRLRAYANIVDGSRDDELRAVLRSAALRIAQYADVALLECTVTDTAQGEELQLWMPPVAEVTSVVDIEAGTDVRDRCRVVGNILHLPAAGDYEVAYRVVPDADTVETFAPLVWQMAVAIWDGNTDEEQKVHKRISAGYVVH